MTDLAIDLKDVWKKYSGGVTALRGIDMQVFRGQIFGLLGPNGAGKSTLVKILMTVIRPTKVTGTMLGAPVGDKETLRRIGYLPEHHRFPDHLTGEQLLHYFGALSGVPREVRKSRSAELLELVGMRAWGRVRVREYSKGMRQRIGIAQALINDPDITVLDEPTDGVDPVGRRDIREMLNVLRGRGKTVLLNSHLLGELELVCDRVAILVQGKVERQGTIDELTRDQRRIVLEIPACPDAETILAECQPESCGRRSFTTRDGYPVTISGSRLSIGCDSPEAMMPAVDSLRGRGIVIQSLRTVRPSLEDLFMQAVIDPLSGEALKPGAATSEANQ